jgi:hypothetical protein
MPGGGGRFAAGEEVHVKRTQHSHKERAFGNVSQATLATQVTGVRHGRCATPADTLT